MSHRRILVALDGSARAEAVLHAVPSLMSEGAELILFRASESKEAVSYLNSLVQRMLLWNAQPGQVRELVHDGPPAASILEAAGQHRCDLIAMTTHGRTGAARALAGSVTEAVVRQSDVPVLVVRRTGDNGPPKSTLPPPQATELKNIVVPLDGTLHARAVLPYAAALAKRHEARLHLFRCAPSGTRLTFGEGRPHLDQGASEETMTPLRQVAVQLRTWGVQALIRVVDGSPPSSIRDFVTEVSGDLIAMTTHGRTGLLRLALGSVAEEVMRSGVAPVLLVRAVAEPTSVLELNSVVALSGT